MGQTASPRPDARRLALAAAAFAAVAVLGAAAAAWAAYGPQIFLTFAGGALAWCF